MYHTMILYYLSFLCQNNFSKFSCVFSKFSKPLLFRKPSYIPHVYFFNNTCGRLQKNNSVFSLRNVRNVRNNLRNNLRNIPE